MAAVYSVRNAVLADAIELGGGRVRGHGVRTAAGPRSESVAAAGFLSDHLARYDRGTVLRGPSDGRLLRPPRAAAAPRARSVFAGLDQRRRSCVAERRGVHR